MFSALCFALFVSTGVLVLGESLTSIRKLGLVTALALVASAAHATPAGEMEKVLQQNFAACGSEDLPALMGTLARDLPDRALFEQEAAKTFAAADVHFSLESFQLIQIRGSMAAARVVQLTSATDKLGNEIPGLWQSYMLLPPAERVEYIQYFKREGGKWKLWQLAAQPVPLQAPSQSIQVKSGCPNGRCGLTNPNNVKSVFGR